MAFIPRDWQTRFVREYQEKRKRNFLVEACTSAGKTGGSLYIYEFLKQAFGWRFLVVVVPSEHLKRQYAVDAQKLFGLQLYYSGTQKSLGRLPTPEELLQKGYQGLVVNYQWLTYSGNAEWLANALQKTLAGKVFAILDEVHHASSELSFGQACEIALSDRSVSHRLMTSGTPFRSDNNKILGNWLTYLPATDNTFKCVPDFQYTLVNALRDGIIPPFSFVTMDGQFTYRRDRYVYEGKTFTNTTDEQELTDALNTAIYIDGDWVKEAILWAHKRMQRDRAKGLPECATYVRVSTIDAARKIEERIRQITGEAALVIVSKDDDPNQNSRFSSRQDPSKLIEGFAAETGVGAKSWIIGVSMLGEGVSINRLKYRIHATNFRTALSFMQDLGRLLRLFPVETPEAVETLIPAHPTLINLALSVLNEVAHVVREKEEETSDDKDSEDGDKGSPQILSMFEAIASTGELGSQIVDSEEIAREFTAVAEWAIEHKEIWRHWSKTPAHLAQLLMKDQPQFDLLYREYQTVPQKTPTNQNFSTAPVPQGFPSEYASWLPDEKLKLARSKANDKVFHLARILYPDATTEEQKAQLQQIHVWAKQKQGLPLKGFIAHEGWEKIYLSLCDRIADAKKFKGKEEL
ncbi:DEAD/DEAH box helicase family protein [Kamptonema sp. UHCC 0994]|uniref:DEAD/DEAH box helicase n=1 Tax=Kamptonema sp. UHCC 0994 TaxID=3031329 RepID=UPI0023B9C668|nr:DEAD/DEAH box helicase family protein [Kamptonema sp. UHCC 0994]MDF0555054.1 DEAD/DEAH box helicase family protein [Kamptonema sp. UHCC 0994]